MRSLERAAAGLALHGLWFGLLFLSLLAEAAPAWAQVVLVALPKGGPTPITEQEVGATPAGVRIQVQGRTLKDVLQRIQNLSGIQFGVADSLLALPVTATIQAPDWPAALQKLLQPFNRGELREGEGHLRHVLVVGHRGQLAPPPMGATSVPGIPAGPPEPPVPPEDPGTAQAPRGVTPPPVPGPGPLVGQGTLLGNLPSAPGPPSPGPGPPGVAPLGGGRRR